MELLDLRTCSSSAGKRNVFALQKVLGLEIWQQQQLVAFYEVVMAQFKFLVMNEERHSWTQTFGLKCFD